MPRHLAKPREVSTRSLLMANASSDQGPPSLEVPPMKAFRIALAVLVFLALLRVIAAWPVVALPFALALLVLLVDDVRRGWEGNDSIVRRIVRQERLVQRKSK